MSRERATRLRGLAVAQQHAWEASVPVFELKREAGDWFHDLPESVNTPPESVNTLPESVNTLPESVNGLPESVNALPESVNALAESVNALAESVNALPESVNALPESVNALPESVNTLPESVSPSVSSHFSHSDWNHRQPVPRRELFCSEDWASGWTTIFERKYKKILCFHARQRNRATPRPRFHTAMALLSPPVASVTSPETTTSCSDWRIRWISVSGSRHSPARMPTVRLRPAFLAA
jgi:hypothetical protein